MRYVAVEGIDGAGKSTLCRNLARTLPGVVLHREPTDGPIGQLIRSTIRTNKDPRYLPALFSADRMLELPGVLDGAPEGSVVLSDRSFLSTMAYQGREDGSAYTVEELYLLHRFVPKPDVVVYLDCPPLLGIARIHGDRTGFDAFENVEYLEGVRERYAASLELLVRESAFDGAPRIQVFEVDGRESPEVVAATVESLLLALGRCGRAA